MQRRSNPHFRHYTGRANLGALGVLASTAEPPAEPGGEVLGVGDATEEGCPFHEGARDHDLPGCGVFGKMTVSRRKGWCRDDRRCFGCLSRGHFRNSCTRSVKCVVCRSRDNHFLLHRDPPKGEAP